MFWKQFKRQPVSAIDGLLSKEDCTLEEILDDDNVVQECKGDMVNKRLLDFIVKEENMDELVKLVTEEPSEDIEEKNRYKHPNRASEVLSCEANVVVDLLVRHHLDKLWGFLESPPPLNPLLASFFTRVLNSLFRCKSQVMLDYMRNRDDAMQQVLNHIETSVIMDLLLSIIISCDSAQMRVELVQWLADVNLVQRLVDLIQPGIPSEKQRNASRVLSEMMRHCYTQLAQSSETLRSDLLLDMLEQDDLVQLLMKNMMATPLDSVPVLHGIDVLQTMLSLQLGLCQSIDRMQANFPVVANEDAARQVVASLTPWLTELHKMLLEPPKARPFTATFGYVAVPFGAARLAVLQLLVLCVQTNVSEFNQEIVRLNIPTTLLDLFFQFWWNSFLHQQVEQFIGLLLCGKGDDQDMLLRALFINGQLLQRIGEAGLANEDDQAQPRGRRRGYMGHLVNLSNSILHTMDNDDELVGLLDGIAEDSLALWRKWVQGPLAAANERCNMVLGGKQPPIPLQDSDEDCRINLNMGTDNVQQAYHEYQTQQLATEFVESFGFEDEDYAEPEEAVTAPFDRVREIGFDLPAELEHPNLSLFQSACEERIRPFGELPNEEPWLKQIRSEEESMDDEMAGMSIDGDGDDSSASSPPFHDSSMSSDDDDNGGPVVVFSDSAVSSPMQKMRENRMTAVSEASASSEVSVADDRDTFAFDDSDEDLDTSSKKSSSWTEEPETGGQMNFARIRIEPSAGVDVNHIGNSIDTSANLDGRVVRTCREDFSDSSSNVSAALSGALDLESSEA